MLKKIFRQDTEVPFNSLQDDLDYDHITLEIKSQTRMSKILRHSRDKPIKQMRIERSRTFHTLSIPGVSTDWNGENGKIVANLKHLKSLRCLYIDLRWFLTLQKGYSQFAQSLKHLKNLSVIHFHVAERIAFLDKIPQIYQSLCNVPIVSRAEVRLSFMGYYGLTKRSFDQLLGAVSRFGCLTSVHLTCDRYSFGEIHGIIALLQDYKSVSRIDITITKMISFFDSGSLQNLLFESLKRIKSLKESRITFRDLGLLPFKELEILVPKLKEVVQFFNLEITFQMDSIRFEQLTTSQWKEFLKSVQKSDSPHRFSANYTGNLVRSFTFKHFLLIFAVCLFIDVIFYLFVNLFMK